MKPRLFLVDDDHSIRQMLAFVLTRTCQCEVVGEAADGDSALRGCAELKPSVLVTDLRLPGKNGIRILQDVRERKLNVPVMFYTGATSEACVLDAIEAAPEGFVLKSDDLDALRQAVRAVAAGAFFWTAGAKELRDKRLAALRRCSDLSASERDILKLVASGMCTKEIATALRKSEHTVSHQRQSIMDKLQVHSAVALAAFARKAGLVD